MSGRRGDLLSFLYLARRLTRQTQPKAGSNNGIRAMFRLMLVFFGLAMFWPLFSNALKHMPLGLWLVISTGLTIRIMRWFFRRLP